MTWTNLITDKNVIYLYKYNFNKDTWDEICRNILDKDGSSIKAISISARFGGISFEPYESEDYV